MEVEAIFKRWRTPVGKCFQVRTSGSLMFELCYEEADDSWKIRPI
jgi:hypothetical protein